MSSYKTSEGALIAADDVVFQHETGKPLYHDGARWVDFTGPVGAGHFAGMTVIPHLTEGRQPFWFVADWGVVTVGQFRVLSLALEPGEIFESAYTVLVHDGELEKDDIEQAMRDTHVS